MTSTCNNSFYTRIQAFGTASAFDPHYIMKAGSIGTPNGASYDSSSSQNSTKTIDVDVDVSDATMCEIFCLGLPIPRNAVIQSVSMNGNRTVNDNFFWASIGLGAAASGAVGCALYTPTKVSQLLVNEAGTTTGSYQDDSSLNGTINDGCTVLGIDKTAFNIITNPITNPTGCPSGPVGNYSDISYEGPIYPVLQVIAKTISSSSSPCCPCPCPSIINAKMTYYCP